MRKLLVGMLLGFSSVVAMSQPLELWKGDGIVYNSKGVKVTDYKLEVKINKLNTNEQSREVLITFPDGKTMKKLSQVQKNGSQWSSNSVDHKGGGFCFKNDLCQEYITEKSGRNFATTIILDSSSKMRLFRNELLNGVNQNFFSEVLVKQ